jgi:F-box and WD-40 domain protein 1/11
MTCFNITRNSLTPYKGAYDLSPDLLELTTGDNGASSAANRLSAHFDMIDISEVQDLGAPSPLYIPPFRRVAYRPAGAQNATRKRFLPRLWDAVALSAVSQSRKKIKEMKLWPDFDIDAVNEWFPLDGEEGELVEDEGFLDALDTPSGSIPASDASASAAVAVNTPSQPRKLDLINHLPPELALHVFLYLDLPSLATVSLVSRYWNGLSRDTQIWRDLFYRQPHWAVNPVKAARKRMRMNSRASRASSTFASPAALYSRWGRNSLLSLRSLAINEAPILETPPLTLALDWADMYKSRLEIDRRWAKGEPKVNRLTGHTDRCVLPDQEPSSVHPNIFPVRSVYCLEFDQHKIVTGSRDRTIKVWSLLSGKLLSTLRGHEGSVLCLKFESASGFMVTGSSDRQILVWDLNMLKNESNVRPRAALRGHTGGVLDLKLDEEWIVSWYANQSFAVVVILTNSPF